LTHFTEQSLFPRTTLLLHPFRVLFLGELKRGVPPQAIEGNPHQSIGGKLSFCCLTPLGSDGDRNFDVAGCLLLTKRLLNFKVFLLSYEIYHSIEMNPVGMK